MKQILLIILGLSVGVSADFSRDNSTNIVVDKTTKLQWQDDAIGSEMHWQDAIGYCESLILGDYSDWRLPNLRELTSIVDDTQHHPAIDHSIAAFQHTASNGYWSSTSDYASYAWYVYFGYGYQDGNYKSSSYYVRCVRDGQ